MGKFRGPNSLTSSKGEMAGVMIGGRKDKRPNIGPAVCLHQNHDALNEAHVAFDFFFGPFFFFAAMTLLLGF
jgi:hypothetical protein